ncbi:tyrosine-protein kinase-like otk [Patella vulgata]|uniref:tyrosine-protein kinase-like otk n=1 Tax=Patella vulgata TaxID=6465 RepID=UPI00217F823E|nr:tyrosine-protein kinase-like otk [Patella vulgata]
MVGEDSTVTFTCSVDGRPSSVISWSRSQQGEQLYSGSQYTISKVSRQHTDNYTCTASNNIGQPVSKTIPLHVTCVPVLDPNQETKTTISVGRGETGVLSIHVLAYPLPVYTWYYQPQDGSKQPITDFRSSQEDNGLSSTLTIQDVTEDDGGKYIVYVNNSLGTRSTVFNLAVTSQDEGCTCSNHFCNDVVSRDLGVGIAIGLGICLVVLGITAVLLWIVLKKSGKKICFKQINGDKTVVNDTVSHNTGLDNITLPDTPHVYDRVNTGITQASTTLSDNTGVTQTSTTLSDNTEYINTSTTSSPYEELDKQTMDQQPSIYQQLSPYQNLSGDKKLKYKDDDVGSYN